MSRRSFAVRDVMTPDVHVVMPTLSSTAAAELMRRLKVRYLVVREGSRLQGVVSERDLRQRRLPTTFGPWAVSDLMAAPVVTVREGAALRRPATLMQGRSLGPLVVTGAGGHVVGIVTAASLLSSLVRSSRHSRRRRSGGVRAHRLH